MKRGYVDTPEGQVHYRAEGKGQAVLMLHQVLLSSDQFTEMVSILGKSYRAVAMDFLGYGNSDQPPIAFSIEDYARNVIHFLDALKIKKTTVVGRLFGTLVGVEMATAYPDRVDKLVLITCPYIETEERKKLAEVFKNKRMEIKADGSHLMEWWKDRMALPNMKPEHAQRATAELLKAGLGVTADDGHRAMYQYDLGPKLPLIKQPTLLMYGDKDARLSRLEPTKKLIPRCQAKVIEGVFTYPTWEKPEVFAKAIIEFIKEPGV